MIRIASRARRPVPAWHTRFLAMLPAIEAHARIAFRGLAPEAREDAVQETIATEQIPGAGELRFLSRINDLVMDLKTDRIDGIVLVGPVAASYAKADDQLVVSDISFGQEDGVAIAIAKGNDDLTASINTTLERLMADDLITQFIAEATALADEQQVE